MKFLITPTEAKSILSRNTDNRKVNYKHVDFLARQMKEGEWIYNGQSIVIGANGVLLDGQHRLMACVASGVPFETEKVEGVQSDLAFATIDTGRLRTANDIIAMNGNRNSNRLTAIARMILELNEFNHNDGDFKFCTRRRFSNNEVLKFVVDNRDLEEFVAVTLKYKTHQVAALYILSGKDVDGVNRFIKKYNDGLFDSMNCPVKRLYEWEARKGTNYARAKTEGAAVTIKSYRAFIESREIKRIFFSFGNERFPVI